MKDLREEVEKILPKESNHYYVDKLLALFAKQKEELIEEIENEVSKMALGQGNIPNGWDANMHVIHESTLGGVIAKLAELKQSIS